jgi:hypothetical protein
MTPPMPQAPYPQANPYAGYYNAPYSYYPWYPPAPLPPTPAERPLRPGRARIANALIAVGVVIVTLGAITVAALAPALTSSPASSPAAGLSQVYSAPLTSDDGQWNLSHGCFFGDGGLHATLQRSNTLCDFSASAAPDLASTGFYLEAVVGPAAAVSGQQKPCIVISTGEDAITAAFDQQGGFGLVLPGATGAEACSIGSALVGSGGYAWHTNGITPNRIGVRYDAPTGTLTVYANGLPIATRSIQLLRPISLSLGASADGEAVFTRFSLYA